MLLGSAVIAITHYWTLVDTHVQQAEHQSILFARAAQSLLWQQHQTFFADRQQPPPSTQSPQHADPDAPSVADDAQREDRQQLDTLFAPLLDHSNIIKFKLYNRDGLTLYSTRFEEIGQSHAWSRGFQEAVGGVPFSELINWKTTHEVLSTASEYVETYFPVLTVPDNRIVGVFEIYVDVGPELGSIRIAAAKQGGLLAGLFTLLFLLIRYADRTVRRQEVARTQELIKAHSAVSDSEARFRGIAESAHDAIVLMDSRGVVTYWNRASEDMFGFQANEIIGRSLHELIVPSRYHEQVSRGLSAFKTTGSGSLVNRTVEFYALRRNGDEFPVELSISGVAIGSEWQAFGQVRDITERRKNEQQLVYLATHDTLTGLPNRSLLEDRLAQAIIHARRYGGLIATLFLDLDQFKLVNDNLGHDSGDRLINIVAERLHQSVREGDTVSRFGGDEFVVILAELKSENDAKEVVEKIIHNQRNPINIGNHTLNTTCSIGVSLFPKDGLDVEALFKCADIAMYQAKGFGGNQCRFYTPEMVAGLSKRMLMRGALHQALERGELVLHYQPQFDLLSGDLVSAEALLRWQRGDGTLVLPQEFIPLAEETGLIVPIGEWVLAAACGQVKIWHQGELPEARVAINLSARQFDSEDIATLVEAALTDVGLEPRYLDIELTESLIMQNPERAITTFKRIKAMGVGVSIDDFGTGYSSLSYLKRFPLDRVKIDRSFVRDLTTDPDDEVIVLTIIAMAHNLRFRVVAEGVENEAQLRFLREHGCDEVQGYVCGKPVPAQRFTALVAEIRQHLQRIEYQEASAS